MPALVSMVRVLPVAMLATAAATACGADDDAAGPSTTVSADPQQAFCQLMQQSDDIEPNGGETPDELEAKLGDLRPLLSRIAEVAPAELSDEIEASVGAYSRLIDVVADADYNLGAVDGDQLGELSDEIDANGNVIQNWLEANCDT
jgi:hypothetical protein